MRTKNYWKTARHASASFIALVLVLITLYAQNQSSRYTASFIGFRRALHYDDAKEASTFEEVWQWFEKMTNSIAADTLGQINANCGYNKPNLQNVNIGGTEYKLFDPQFQFGPCDNFQYLNDPNEKVYLSDTGNHELKTVGVFTGRSTSVPSRNKEKLVQNNELAQVDAVTDDRILDICDETPWNRPCVLRDGFEDSLVSTLEWSGEVIDGYHAFNTGSFTRLLRPSQDKVLPQFNIYSPCFNNVSGVLTSPEPAFSVNAANPMEGYGSCYSTWVTPGYEVRKNCLDAQVTQADAKYAFMISVLNYTSLTEMRNLAYGCEAILNLNSDEVKNANMLEDAFVENSLESGKMYGLFIKTDSQGAWIEDSTKIFDQMSFSKLIDRSTRIFNVIAITRNDGTDDLYYSKITFSFKMLVDGKIILRMEASYIPIVAYMYGLDDHPWMFREVVIFESFFLLMLVLFTIRETHQDYKSCLRFFSAVSLRGTSRIHCILGMEASSSTDSELGNEDNDDGIIATHNHDKSEDSRGDHVEMGIISARGGRESDAIIDRYHGHGDEEESAEEVKDKEVSPSNAMSEPSMLPSMSVASMEVEEMTLIPDDSNWYNIIDWIAIIVGFILVYYRVTYVQLCYDAVNYLEDLDVDTDPEAERSRYEDSFGVTLNQFTEIEDYETSLYVISMVMVLICVIQFFRYLEFDARFGIVARTLRQSLWVLLPVLVVFMTILSTYAVIGTVLYGKFLPEWSTFYNSLGSLFLLILGEFEGYPRMRNVNSGITGIFFWTFVSFVILVLFNMVLAIILTVYDETYKQISLEAAQVIELAKFANKKDT
jgi:hypothetical protein